MTCARKRTYLPGLLLLAAPLAAAALRSRPVGSAGRSAPEAVPVVQGATVPAEGAAVSMDLPVFMPSGGGPNGTKPLTAQHFAHTFDADELGALNYSQAHGWMQYGTACSPANTIFDFGFYDGADGQAYLDGGFCVIGVEADPVLVQQAVNNFAVWMATGQLRVANVAISPSSANSQWTTFYTSKCTREWNSFYKTVGCRGCAPPHTVDMTACDQVPVAAVQCKDMFAMFGKPLYLKLDIEGAEPGCFEALGTPWGMQFLPQFMSAEITEVVYIDTLYNLGYRSFKLVRQDRLHSGQSSRSGPWGHNALDCRVGPTWRTYEEARAEFAAIVTKGFVPHDPCPGGLCTIHGDGGCQSTTYIWYDVHVTTDR